MCCIAMSSSFKVNLLKSIGLLQLGYIFPGSETVRNEWVRNVSGNSDVNKDQTDHDETVLIGEWHRCSSGAVQISCIASRQFISSRADGWVGGGLLHVARCNTLKYLGGFHAIIRPFINFVISLNIVQRWLEEYN